MDDKPVPIRFCADTHIARAVTDQLRAKGVDIVRCEEVGLAEADDVEHLDYAAREGRVIVTQDKDFLRLHSVWQSEGKVHSGIMYCLPHLKGAKYAGRIIQTCLDYHELVAGGAATLEGDVVNQVIYVG
ncbi:MAG TPA: DUF5615 family PIN-like protein [Aggregatilineaceae bacterium]|jgi:hypothetical protein|nr:DUF5615 family PIN-like protein [Aggregatilineaceae bacterium]